MRDMNSLMNRNHSVFSSDRRQLTKGMFGVLVGACLVGAGNRLTSMLRCGMDRHEKNRIARGTPAVREHLRSQPLGEGLLLYAKSDQTKIGFMNATGKRVWDLCRGNASTAEIASVVGREFGVPQFQVLNDLIPLLRRLERKGLIHF
jgi:hypothetical protein